MSLTTVAVDARTSFVVSMLSTLAAALCLASSASAADLNREMAFNIPEQPLSLALADFSRQADISVAAPSAITDGKRSKAVNETMTGAKALERLLEGTNLGYRQERDGAIVVAAPTVRAESETGTDILRVAQADSVAGDARAEVEGGAGNEGEKEGAQLKDEGVQLDEIVVTGTHIRGSQNNTAPVTVFDRAYIDSTGVSTAAALIETLPQNFAQINQRGLLVPGDSSAVLQGASINLRAVGEGTTLILLNGRRMAPGAGGAAVDISALPLSAIEKVEVMTDGGSALYGSDAIGGVVNFILRDDFAGAETRLRAGTADGGVGEYRVSQALGSVWDSGNAMLSLEYYKRDLLRAADRSFVPAGAVLGSLMPRDKNYTAMASGKQHLGEDTRLFFDALYTKRDTYNEGGQSVLNQSYTSDNRQSTVTGGLSRHLAGDWEIEASASYSKNDLHSINRNLLLLGSPSGAALSDSAFTVEAGQLKADGSVLTLPGGALRLALGVDWRSESYRRATSFESGQQGTRGDFDQIVRSAFAEAYVPIVGAANAKPGIQRIEFSLAGRVDDYSSFGSSVDPRVGLMWEPVAGLRLRASYGTSYKAPKLDDYDTSRIFAVSGLAPDPGVPSGFSTILEVGGGPNVAGFSAQEATSSSFGVEFTPTALAGLNLGLNYYRISYRNQIADPPVSPVILGNPASFGDLIVRAPTADQVNTVADAGKQGQGFFVFFSDGGFAINPSNFDTTTVEVIVDVRRRNMSVVRTSGVDLSAQYAFEVAGGRTQIGLNGTYIVERVEQTTATSPGFDTVGTFYNPPTWRARASFGFERRNWNGNLFINHTDSYTDNRITTAPLPVSSYTTVDGRIAYDFGRQFTLALSAQNLLDRDPPAAAIVRPDSDAGFDPTNANPMGRLVALEFVKSWGGH